MKKRIIASLLCVAVIATSLFMVVACNDKDANTPTSFEMPVGTRPNYDSLISSTDKAIIDKGLAESAKAESDETKDQDAIKAAVMVLYTVANKSRIETPLSLVVQESDAGISMAKVLMHSFNLRQGDKWYYQLATSVQPASDDPLYKVMAAAAAAFAGYLKVAYTATANTGSLRARARLIRAIAPCLLSLMQNLKFKKKTTRLKLRSRLTNSTTNFTF